MNEFFKKLIDFDKTAFIKINKLNNNNNKFLSCFLRICSENSDWFFFVIYAFILFALKNKYSIKSLIFVKSLLIPFLAMLFNFFLRLIIKRKRPFNDCYTKSVCFNNNVNLHKKIKANSMPSNHTFAAFSIAIISFQISVNIGFLLVFLSIITGISRVATGKHFPLDVLVAILVSVLFNSFAWYFLQ